MTRTTHRPAAPVAVLLALALVVTGLVAGTASPAHAAAHRVALRVLVVGGSDPATQAVAAELDRQGVPRTLVDLADADRPAVDPAFLEDAATGTGRYQAVVLPNQAGGGLGADELSALAAYEAAYGVRRVNGYDYPGASMGARSAASGWLDGVPAAVTPAGLSGPFSYLRGPLTIEDSNGRGDETFGYLAVADPALPAGQSFTPLVTATLGGTTGSVLGVYAHDGREELVVTASFNQYMQWYNVLAEGIVAWATRGIHLGHNRNYFNVHVDDVLLPDSRWSADGNCTPGDDCVDPSVGTPDIRMTPADVDRLVAWQDRQGFSLDMVFNGAGAEAARAENGGRDPLTDALLAQRTEFPWINHTWSHPYLGCIQVPPAVQGQLWTCKTSPEQQGADEDVVEAESGGTWYASRGFVADQVTRNADWARANGLDGLFDPAELVTGEHSGLASLPQMPADNPFTAPALQDAGVRFTASDASREPDQRALAGGFTSTVPRHPMNVFYNAGRYRDQVDEYNWIYTARSAGGSGICEDNPATTTCIAPLPSADAAQSRASYEGSIVPVEVRNALRFVLANDPRAFYVHQSNLAEDGLLYPVLDGVLDTYRATFDTQRAPVVRATLTEQHQVLDRLATWRAANGAGTFTDGWVDAEGVHLPAGTSVPLTVPEGTTGVDGLAPYAGALSGWVGGGGRAVLTTPGGGYTVTPSATVPGAPTGAVAVPAAGAATVTWTAPGSDGGSPLTGYTVRVYAGTSATPARTLTRDADATTLTVGSLTDGTAYRFDVAATNALGTGPASAPTTPVTPAPALAPVPTAVSAQPGNAAVTVRWTAPASTSGVTGYRVRAYRGTSAARTVTVPADRTVAAMSGLANGTAYTFTVNAVSGTTQGALSARSPAVTPSRDVQTDVAPAVETVVAGQGSVTLSWQPPQEAAGQVVTGYRVRVFVAGTTTVARGVTLGASPTSATVKGLADGRAYEVEVNLRTADGNGPTSARSAAVTPQATVPGAPRIGSASSGASGGAVTGTARWSPPSSTGGSVVTGYVVTATRYDASGGVLGTTTSAVLPASARSTELTLPATGTYRFTVVARNAVGTGPASARSNAVTGR